jgi:CBS domain-containing protein
VTVLLLKRSILTEKIARRGRHITREYSTDPFELMRAADLMVTEVDVLAADMLIDDAVAYFSASEPRHKAYPIVDRDRRVLGMASRSDVLRWRTEAAHTGVTLYDAASDTETAVAHPDDVLGRIADLMVERDTGRIPIVEREGRRLVGLISRKDLLRVRDVRNSQEHQRNAFIGRPASSRQTASLSPNLKA